MDFTEILNFGMLALYSDMEFEIHFYMLLLSSRYEILVIICWNTFHLGFLGLESIVSMVKILIFKRHLFEVLGLGHRYKSYEPKVMVLNYNVEFFH